jgi:hypothetical protein
MSLLLGEHRYRTVSQHVQEVDGAYLTPNARFVTRQNIQAIKR